jgi:uncharacterized protein YecE (DUF72 family)
MRAVAIGYTPIMAGGDTVAVGTSGWSYDDWAKRFFAGVPRSRWLEHYAGRFPTVEVNATFYRLPSARMIDGWRERTPEDFRFVFKGSRLITHAKRLIDCESAVRVLFERIQPLGKRLRVMLWQLPPDLERDADRLDAFLALLPAPPRHAVEFRHPSWLREDVFAVLRRHAVASVAISGLAMPPNQVLTADFAYVRFHGLRDGFRHDYTRAELGPWVRFLRGVARDGRSAYAFFNNDGLGHAPENALQLMDALGDVALRRVAAPGQAK